MSEAEDGAVRRNKGFEETHRDLIETAVRLISERGADALSVAELARVSGVNRTTVYYHFANRDALVAAVKAWSGEQLAKAFQPIAPQEERIDYIAGFVLKNPELIKLWIEDFVSTGDIRDRYPQWDAFVSGVRASIEKSGAREDFDAEVLCVILLTSAIIGPRVFRNSVAPDASDEEVLRRFRGERQFLLKCWGLLAR